MRETHWQGLTLLECFIKGGQNGGIMPLLHLPCSEGCETGHAAVLLAPFLSGQMKSSTLP